MRNEECGMKDKKSLPFIHHSSFIIHHFLERLLTALDRVPGLGGGITHLVFLSLFFGTSFALYLTVLRLRGPAVAFRTRIGWDTAFPFTPWWVWIYLLPYVLGPLLTIVMSRTAFAWYIRR